MALVLLLALVMLVLAAQFARHADAGRLAMLRSMTWAQVFAIVSGVAGNLVAVLWAVSGDDDLAAAPLRPLLRGLGEALTPAALGGAALTVTWILIAYGLRRLPTSDLEP